LGPAGLAAVVTVRNTSIAQFEVFLSVPSISKPRQVVWSDRGLKNIRLKTQLGGTGQLVHLGNRFLFRIEPGHGEQLSFSIEYTKRLRPFRSGLPQVLLLSRRTPSALASLLAPESVPRSVPWVTQPDLQVIVHCSEICYSPIGPFYEGPERSKASHDTWIRLRSDSPFDTLCIAPISRIKGDSGVFLLDPLKHVDDGLIADVRESYDRVRESLKSRFGDPVLQPRGVVLFDARATHNHLIGSYVFLNVADLRRYTRPDARKARIVGALAHELAHLWWVFGVTWRERSWAILLNEAIATYIESQTSYDIGGSIASRLLKRGQVYRIGVSSGRSFAWLRRGENASFAATSAGLLLAAAARSANCVDDALIDIWRHAHEGPVSLVHMRDALDHLCRRPVGQAFLDALVVPPLVRSGRVRVKRDRLSWRLLIKRWGPQQDQFECRLSALKSRQSPSHLTNHWVVFNCNSSEELGQLSDVLLGSLVLFRRDSRLAAIERSRVLRSVWDWCQRQIERGNGRSQLFVAGLIAVAMNSEHPRGFMGLSVAFRGVSSRLSTTWLLAAARRSIYRGEESIRRPLAEHSGA
jgi:hypothetical protein